MTPLAQLIHAGLLDQVEGDFSMVTPTAIDVFSPIDLDKLAEFIDKRMATMIDIALS